MPARRAHAPSHAAEVTSWLSSWISWLHRSVASVAGGGRRWAKACGVLAVKRQAQASGAEVRVEIGPTPAGKREVGPEKTGESSLPTVTDVPAALWLASGKSRRPIMFSFDGTTLLLILIVVVIAGAAVARGRRKE